MQPERDLRADGEEVSPRASERLTLLLVNPHLRGERGHCLPYDLSVREQARRRRHEVYVFGNRDVEPPVRKVLDAIPHFPSAAGSRRGWLPLPRRLHGVKHLLSFVGAVRETFEYGTGTRRVFFYPNCGDVGESLALALGLCLAPVDSETCYVLLFRWNPPDGAGEGRTRGWVRWTFRLLERAARRHAIRLVTDSDRLAEAYREITSLPFEVVPIPHVPPAAEARPPGPPQPESGPPRLVYVGGARREQGVHLLADALVRLRDELAAGELCATVHLAPPAHDAVAVENCRKLEAARLENVEIRRGVLPRAEYEQILRNADLVVIPYLAAEYTARTSGVLTEAISLGKPIVAPRETWMGDQASRGGGVLFDGETGKDLARAIRTATGNLDELKVRATLLQPRWNRFHSPENLYHHLVDGSARESSTA